MTEEARQRRLVQAVRILSPAGELEGLLEAAPQREPAQVAVVCHPHPLYGGTMHTKVVFQAARALARVGMAVLRFNFRGVGGSKGQYDEGRGEQDDVRGALNLLEERFPRAGIVLAGFSFGARVGLEVGCQDRRVTLLVGIGLPADQSDLSYLLGCTKPKLFVQGTRDQFGSVENVTRLFDQLSEPKKLVWVEGADHFLDGYLDELRHAITEYFAGE